MEKEGTRCAMVFAAGLGTRLRPLTDQMPKALVPYKGVPLLESLLNKLRLSGFDRVVINVHHFADMIEAFVAQHNNFGMEVFFSDERDLLRETGGGIKHAQELILGEKKGENVSPFLVHNVDIVSNIELPLLYNSWDQTELARLVVSQRRSSRYFIFDNTMRLVGWTNVNTQEVKSPFSELASSTPAQIEGSGKYRLMAFGGIHLISPSVFQWMGGWPEKFSIVDFYLSVADRCVIRGYVPPMGCDLVDVGKLDQLK